MVIDESSRECATRVNRIGEIESKQVLNIFSFSIRVSAGSREQHVHLVHKMMIEGCW